MDNKNVVIVEFENANGEWIFHSVYEHCPLADAVRHYVREHGSVDVEDMEEGEKVDDVYTDDDGIVCAKHEEVRAFYAPLESVKISN